METRLNTIFEATANAKKVPAVGAIVVDSSGEVLYKGAFGTTDLADPSAPPFTTTTQVALWSCTKLITCVAALQLLEQGKLSLEDPVEKYVPKIKEIQVLDGFEENGTPKLRDPKTKPTILHLMTHTAGFTYDFFEKSTLQWRVSSGQQPGIYAVRSLMSCYMSPLIADPGERYCYGINIDWLGFVIEAVSGQNIYKYCEEHILQPLGMKQTRPFVDKGTDSLKVHFRNDDGSLTANPAIEPDPNAEVYGGGHYMVSTIEDYAKFLLTILVGGTDPITKTKLLEKETVQNYLFSDHIHKVCSSAGIGEVDHSIPLMSNVGTMLPGVKKGWSCGLMLNLDNPHNGRQTGSGAWAGLGNLYYWLDPTAGKLGFLATEILPFMDETAVHLFDELERAVYGRDAAKVMGEHGSTFAMTEGISYKPHT